MKPPNKDYLKNKKFMCHNKNQEIYELTYKTIHTLTKSISESDILALYNSSESRLDTSSIENLFNTNWDNIEKIISDLVNFTIHNSKKK